MDKVRTEILMSNIGYKTMFAFGGRSAAKTNIIYKDTLSQVSIHVAASHKASQHQTLISQIQIVGPHAILA